MLEKMIYGVEFFRHPGPSLDELKKDMGLFKEKGFNTIRVQETWSYEEPEKGVYDFDKIRRIVDYAEQIGMDVVITFTLDCVPAWLCQDHDIFLVNGRGEKCITIGNPYTVVADGKPGPCWDNPITRRAAEKFVSAFLAEFGSSPAIKGWSVWQEAGLWAVFSPSGGYHGAMYCFCKHSLREFRDWLKKKYITIDACNEACMVNYRSWDRIEPPRNRGTTPLGAEHARWLLERSGRIAAWKRELVRKYDPKKRPVMCHTSGSIPAYTVGNFWADDYLMAKDMDGFGKSIYPGWHATSNDHPNEHLHFAGFMLEAARGAADGKTIWAAELQAGRPFDCDGLFRCTPPRVQDLENWNLMALACGVKGFIHWAYREEILLQESYGFGMLSRRGEPFPWFEGLVALTRFLRQHEEYIKPGQPPRAEVVMAINRDGYILGHQSRIDDLVINLTKRMYECLLDGNVFVDFIWNEQVENGNLRGRKIVFLPFPLMMSETYAKTLADYVHHGGVLISAACPAIYNELSNATMASPAYELDAVFGCKEDNVYSVSDEMLEGDNGLHVKTTHSVQTYRDVQGEVILRWNGLPAGVVNHFGKGKAYIIGTFFSPKVHNRELIQYLLHREGIVLAPADSVMVRRLESEHGQVVILYNRGNQTVREDLGLSEYSLIDSYGGRVTIREDCLRVELEPQRVACLILGRPFKT